MIVCSKPLSPLDHALLYSGLDHDVNLGRRNSSEAI